MRINRRQFLQYCIGSAAALGLPLTVLGKLELALADTTVPLPKVLWLNGANCTGCTVSLANLFSNSGPRDIADLLLNTIDLSFHANLMGAAGELAVQQLKDTTLGQYILVMEGGIPTAFNGNTCLLWSENGKDVTAMEAVRMLAPKAISVLCVGTCASFGGIPAGSPNPTGVVSVGQLTGLPTINIPGCPTHPDWIVYVIASLLAGTAPQLDARRRPKAIFNRKIHDICPRKGRNEAKVFGIPNDCLKALGCKGPETFADCPARKWNSETNWCIGAGAICAGCTEQGFPDRFSPFYKLEYGYREFTNQNPQQPAQALSFTKAEWHKKKRLLVAEGKGKANQIVTITRSDSGVQLGAVSVRQDGVWKFQQSASQYISSLTAASGGEKVQYNVARK